MQLSISLDYPTSSSRVSGLFLSPRSAIHEFTAYPLLWWPLSRIELFPPGQVTQDLKSGTTQLLIYRQENRDPEWRQIWYLVRVSHQPPGVLATTCFLECVLLMEGRAPLQTVSKQSYWYPLPVAEFTLLVARKPLEMNLCPWLSLGWVYCLHMS